MPEEQIARFTDKFATSINTLYRTGGFALAFGFAGIVMMLGARLFGQEDFKWLMIPGALLTFSCLSFFLYTTVHGKTKAAKALRDNKGAIDAVQDISIELTRLVNVLQAYSFKNLNRISEALKVAVPALQNIPFIGDKIKEYGLDDATLLSQAIVDYSERTERIVSEIEQALKDADHKKLAGYSAELADLVKLMRSQLKK